MSHAHGTTDAAIRAMLAARAARAGPFRIDVPTVVAAAGPRAARGLLGGRRMERLFLGVTAIAAVIIAGVLAAGPLATVPAGSLSPTSPPGSTGPVAPSGGPSPSALAQARLLTAAEFGDLVRARSTTLPSITVAVSGTLETDPTVQCRGSECPTVLAGSGGLRVRQVGDIGPGPWDGSGPVTGSFALRTGTVVPDGAHVAEFIGALTVPPTGGPAWFVQDLREGAVKAERSYAAVQGWLVRGPAHPCASDPANPVVAYGCPTEDWLSEDPFQPLQANGQTLGPPAAIELSTGSYDRWAPNPAPFGLGNAGVQPRFATFLMWLVSDGCASGADCFPPPPRWRIVGRFDPVIAPIAEPGVKPSPSPATSEHPIAAGVWTVAQLMDQRPPATTDYEVDGWLEAEFRPVRCAMGVTPPGWPRHDCSPDWLTDAPFRPSPSHEKPNVGIQLQSGAYGAFAPNPVWTELVAEPRFGRYVVRVALHSTCEAAVPQPDASCAGGPVWTFELVGGSP